VSSLLHPGYFEIIPLLSARIRRSIERLSDATVPSQEETRGITVGIRTLNEADKLERLLLDIERQDFDGPIEVIIVDNESSDNTKEIAKKFGAKVLTLPRSDFTYPKSMNMAMDAASHELVFLTVGHAELISTKSFRAGVAAMNSKKDLVAGAFGHALPGSAASTIEGCIAMGSIFNLKGHAIHRASIGTMAATGCVLRKSVWKELGKFDERFERGGEDTELARKMLTQGYLVYDEPLLSTHHTHGLNALNTMKQWYQWARSNRPSRLSTAKLKKRRPDLDLDS